MPTIELIEPPAPPPNGWRVDKSIPVSMILSLVIGFTVQVSTMSVMWASYTTKTDARMQSFEDARTVGRAAQKERDERQDQALKDALEAQSRLFDKLDSKLDRVIETQRRP